MHETIAIFAKAAIPGNVKTRLTPALTNEQAAAFHEACVREVFDAAFGLVGDNVRLYTDVPYEPWMQLAGVEHVHYQRGEDLGERMLHCFEDLYEEGFKRLMIIGADSPQVPPKDLREGLDLLNNERDAVLGMCSDGGYYAVGCRKPRRMMFSDVSWSTPLTYSETRAAFELAGLKLQDGMYMHYDVDTFDDLARLRGEARLGPALRAWFLANTAS